MVLCFLSARGAVLDFYSIRPTLTVVTLWKTIALLIAVFAGVFSAPVNGGMSCEGAECHEEQPVNKHCCESEKDHQPALALCCVDCSDCLAGLISQSYVRTWSRSLSAEMERVDLEATDLEFNARTVVPVHLLAVRVETAPENFPTEPVGLRPSERRARMAVWLI